MDTLDVRGRWRGRLKEIFHVHLHVFPHYEGDSFRVSADWGKNPPRKELDRVAQQIGEAYQKLWGSDDWVPTHLIIL